MPLYDEWCDTTKEKDQRKEYWCLVEKADGRDAIRTSLADIIRSHYDRLDRIADDVARLGYEGAAEILRAQLPQTAKGRSGDLGEILATELVEEGIGLRVPVRRLRYRTALPQIQSDWNAAKSWGMLHLMADVFKLIWWAIIDLFRSGASLAAEIVALRQQLNVVRRKSPKRPVFSALDRLIFVGLYLIGPRLTDALAIVEPKTVIRWRRAGFSLFSRWKSRPRSGWPRVALEIRQLIRDISLANPLWGAPRIHGVLLKLGLDIGQTSVAKYMA